MADQRILHTDRMVGAGHPTLQDTLNKLTLVEHNTDGTHKMDIIQQASGSVNGIMSSTDKAKLDDIDLAGTGVGQPFIKFDLNATGAPTTEGTVNWNNAENCLEFKTGLGNVVQIGKELGDSGVNKTGGTVTDGQVVYASGAQDKKKMEFSYADARDANKCSFVGVVTYSTANNAEGPVTSYGTVNNLDTSGWAEDTKLYVAANGTGNLTSIAPAAPNFRVWVATVTYSHVSQGSIFVDPKLDYSNGVTFTSLDVLNNLTVGGTINGTTVPTSKTLVTTVDTQTLTGKTISADSNTLSGIAASSFVLSNASGNIDGVAAQKAIPAGVVVGTTDTQTLTNKTLTSPTINDGTCNLYGGTFIAPLAAPPAQTANGSVVWDSDGFLLTVGDGTSRKTMVDTSTTQTLTNKTLTAPVISSITNIGTLTLPTSTDTLVGRDTTDTLTNKTLSTLTVSNLNTGSVSQSGGASKILATNSSSRLLLDATDDGVNKLQVNGGIRASSFDAGGGVFTDTGHIIANYGLVFRDFSGGVIAPTACLAGYGGIRLYVTQSKVVEVSPTGLAVTGGISAVVGGTTSLLAGNTLSLTCANTDQSHIYMGGTTTPQKGAIHYSDNADVMWFNTGSTERMCITSTGNLLVGTTVDDGENKLRVNGSIKAGIVNASTILVTNTNGITLSDNAVNSFISYGYNSGRTNAAGHVWYDGITTECARIIPSTRNLLIGTATDDGVNKLQVNGGISASSGVATGSGGLGPTVVFKGFAKEGGANMVSIYWSIAAGSANAGGCIGAYATDGTFAAPTEVIDDSKYWTLFGFIKG